MKIFVKIMCQYNIKYNFIIIIIIHFKTTVTTMVLYTQYIYIYKKSHEWACDEKD